jgi:hypothetical protein
MTSYTTAIASVVLIIFGLGQTPEPRFLPTPDGFAGLTLAVTTVAEAEAQWGPPDSDKIDKLEVSKLDKWLDPKHKEKIFRQLTYKKSPDFLEMKLSFLDDKLVMIDLVYKKRVTPDKLNGLFRAQFALLGGPASLPDQPGKYPIVFFASHYPTLYSMVAISDKTFIFVNCASEGGGTSPGRVERTRQVSRLLEKK